MTLLIAASLKVAACDLEPFEILIKIAGRRRRNHDAGPELFLSPEVWLQPRAHEADGRMPRLLSKVKGTGCDLILTS
jgi:hypothetical protein